ncbi:MAG: tyrosine--tRNA ligase [Phycisphaerae bacterium]|nr:tyrosine--tRNA ligase [Phycisphaerae bacterium]
MPPPTPQPTPDPCSFIEELRWRGLLHQCTDEAGLAAHLKSGVRRAYIGYDPTADSLTIGNLVTIMMLVHFQRHGHSPVVVMGGGTGLIGDPSGKSAERMLMTEEMVNANVESQKRIFGRLLDFSGTRANAATIVNNANWLTKLGYLEILRDVGKHFSVNEMVKKDSVRNRLEARDQGISYTEFSYMVLQSYDFLHLFKANGVTLQMGGSDQWGNIVGGIDLIERWARTRATAFCENHASPKELDALALIADAMRKDQPHASRTALLLEAFQAKVGMRPGLTDLPTGESFGLTAPLVTKADGGKFGKTESGAVWLTAERTSPFDYYQFWLNTADADVGRFLRVFTLLSRAEIEDIEAAHAEEPGARFAQKSLARAATLLLHGEAALREAESRTAALFARPGEGDAAAALDAMLAKPPDSVNPITMLDGPGAAIADLLVHTKVASSKREAREWLAAGAISLNGAPVAPDKLVTRSDLHAGKLLAIRRGKKTWHGAVFS